MSEPLTVQVVSARVDANRDRLDRHETEHETIWKKLNKVENRLPTWSTLFIAVLTALVGSLITALVGVLI